MKTLHFGDLIRQALDWAWKNKILWIFGIFLGGGGLSIPNVSSNDWEKIQQMYSSMGDTTPIFQEIGSLENLLTVRNIAIVVGALVIIGLIFIILSFFARAAMIFGLNRINQSKSYKFWELLKLGVKKFPRLFLMEIILGIPNLILLIPFAALIFDFKNKSLIALVIVAVVFMLIYNLMLFMFRHYSYCFAVLQEKSAWQSIKSGWQMFRSNLKELILVKVVEILLSILIAIGMITVIIILMIPLGLLGGLFLFGFGSGTGIAAAVVLGIIFILIMALIKGSINTFMQAYLTKVYFEVRTWK